MPESFAIIPPDPQELNKNWLMVLPSFGVMLGVVLLAHQTMPLPVQLLLVLVIPGVILLLLQTLMQKAKNTRFEIGDQHLQIFYPKYGRSLNLSDLDLAAARVLDLGLEQAYKPALRTNGVGMFGFGAGWFRLKNGQKALLFVSDRHQVLCLPTRLDYVLMLSPQNPQVFLQALQTRLK